MDKVYAIDVTGLTKRFGAKTAVDGIDIRVPHGYIYGFLGPNGSGKTTTIRMLCGLLTPDGGSGTCLGFDIQHEAAEIKRRIGYMTQRFSFYEDLTVEENLAFVAQAYDVPERAAAITRVIADCELQPYRRQLAGTLSGGWKQRVGLAACLIHSPQLLMLDEPTAGVDPEARRSFWNKIHDIAAAGVTVLVTTHYMDEVERCHEITYLADGHIVTSGTPRSVIEESPLKALEISGPDLDKLAEEVRARPGIASVAALGGRIVVTARDRAALDQVAARYEAAPGYAVARVSPSFEDVFVELIAVGKERQSARGERS